MLGTWYEDGSASPQEMPEPVPGPGEALLQLRVAGIGPLDLPPPTAPGIPGSEFVATVLQAEASDLVGKRTIGRVPVPCGACRSCHAGRPHACILPEVPGRSGRWGCLAQRFCFPERALVPLPPDIRDYDAVMAWPLAAGLAARTRVETLPPAPAPATCGPGNPNHEASTPRLRSGQAASAEPGSADAPPPHREATGRSGPITRALVTGTGYLPLALAAALRRCARKVYLSCGDEARVDSFRTFGLLSDPGGRFPLVVAPPGRDPLAPHILDRVEAGGTLLLAGHSAGRMLQLPDRLVSAEITVAGSGPGRIEDVFQELRSRDMCEMLSRARAEVLPLERAAEALELARRDLSFRVLVDNL